jgi:ABC-type lipoprotein export system ATPase subunit
MAQYAFVSLLYIFGCIYASAAELPVNNIEPVETARLEPHSDRILHVTQHRQLQADTSGNAKYVCSDIELEETESCSECEDGVDNDGDGIEDCGDVDCQFTYHCKMERANENSFNNTAATWRAIWIVILVSLVPLGVAAWAQLKDLKYHRHIKGNTQVIGRSQIDGVVNPSALSESLSGPNGTTENGVVDDSAPRLTLSVGYLDYWVNVKMNAPGLAGLISKSTIQRKQLLRDFTASFPPNTLTGIMGPSGCGKTVLLNLLSGRQKTGEFSGLRMVNGEAMSMNRFRAVMQQQGYVRQEDTFFEDLTVRDTLLYSSMLGLPEETSIADKMSRVDSVLAEIGLTGAADAKVGGLKFKGISGGQKRRLSIAIELVRARARPFLVIQFSS